MFHFKANRKNVGSYNKTVLGTSGIFGVTITGNFECFHYFKYEIKFLKNKNLFFKKLGNSFVVNSTTIESVTSIQNWPITSQIEWGVQNGPTTKNAVLPISTLFFWKFYFSIRTCYKELIWSTNYPNVHIHTSWKRWNFISGSFFTVNILETYSAAIRTISIRMCHVLWEQFCCLCMSIKTVRNKSQLFKETTRAVKLLRCWSAWVQWYAD